MNKHEDTTEETNTSKLTIAALIMNVIADFIVSIFFTKHIDTFIFSLVVCFLVSLVIFWCVYKPISWFEVNLKHNVNGEIQRDADGTTQLNAKGTFRWSLIILLIFSVISIVSVPVLLVNHHQETLRQEQIHRESLQVNSLVDSIRSVQTIDSFSVFQVNKIDSVWLVSPMDGDTFVGAYTHSVNNEITQNPLSDISMAIESFCKHHTRGYTEYKSCTELVTVKNTTTRVPGRQLGKSSFFSGQFVTNPWSSASASDSELYNHKDFSIESMTQTTLWSIDSTKITYHTQITSLHFSYDVSAHRWKVNNIKPDTKNTIGKKSFIKLNYGRIRSVDDDELKNLIIAGEGYEVSEPTKRDPLGLGI